MCPPGDYVGPKSVAEGVRVIQAIAKKQGHTVKLETALLGIGAIEKTGKALPADTWAKAKASDVVSARAGGRAAPGSQRPRFGRSRVAWAAQRPSCFRQHPSGQGLRRADRASTLFKPEVVRGVDMIILRELTGGAYFGKPQGRSGRKPNRAAVDTTLYTEEEVRRLMRVGFELARGRKEEGFPGRQVKRHGDRPAVARDRPRGRRRVSGCAVPGRAGRRLRHASGPQPASMRTPIATLRISFGDILSDEAAMLAGSDGRRPAPPSAMSRTGTVSARAV